MLCLKQLSSLKINKIVAVLNHKNPKGIFTELLGISIIILNIYSTCIDSEDSFIQKYLILKGILPI